MTKTEKNAQLTHGFKQTRTLTQKQMTLKIRNFVYGLTINAPLLIVKIG